MDIESAGGVCGAVHIRNRMALTEIAPVRQPNSLTTAAVQTAGVVRFHIEADG